MRYPALLVVFAGCLCGAAAADAGTINAFLAADSRFGFYTGDAAGTIVHFRGANQSGRYDLPDKPNWKRADNFVAETRDPVIYIAAWSAHPAGRGLLASFRIDDAATILSGDARWQVFRTGLDQNHPSQPPLGELSRQISLANHTDGWKPVSTRAFDRTAPWGPVAGVDPSARWMWSEDRAGRPNPHEHGPEREELLVFRVVVPEPTPLTLLVLGAVGLLICGRAPRIARVVLPSKSDA